MTLQTIMATAKEALATADLLSEEMSINRYLELVELIDTMQTRPGEPTNLERTAEFGNVRAWLAEYEADAAALADYGYHIEDTPAPFTLMGSTYTEEHPITGYKRNFNHNHRWTIEATPDTTMTAHMRRAGTKQAYKYSDHFHLNEVDNLTGETLHTDPEAWTLKQAQDRRRKLKGRRNGNRVIVRKCQTNCGKEPVRKSHAKAYNPAHAFAGTDMAREGIAAALKARHATTRKS